MLSTLNQYQSSLFDNMLFLEDGSQSYLVLSSSRKECTDCNQENISAMVWMALSGSIKTTTLEMQSLSFYFPKHCELLEEGWYFFFHYFTDSDSHPTFFAGFKCHKQLRKQTKRWVERRGEYEPKPSIIPLTHKTQV